MKVTRHIVIGIMMLGLLSFLVPGCKGKGDAPHAEHNETVETYTCPMHPEIVRNQPGSCPICGMDLVKKEAGGARNQDVELEALLRPTNEFVLASVPVITPERGKEEVELEALGSIAYDTRQVGSIASKVGGRIERLYVRYRYQEVRKGQRIMDIYSPELMTAQQNYLFLLRNDPDNESLISSARQRLLLLGMSQGQLASIVRTGKPELRVAVYSNFSGHLHEAGSTAMAQQNGIQGTAAMQQPLQLAGTTEELPLKEGMYVEKGQAVFTIYNPDRAWVLLNVYGINQGLVKRGTPVRVVPETAPAKNFRATIDYIEPYYRSGNKSFTARVYFNNAAIKLPIGSPVTATIFTDGKEGLWLPRSAVLSLGINQVVFRKVAGGFMPHKVSAGMQAGNRIIITSGLSATDSIAANAQFLTDSESFIKVND